MILSRLKANDAWQGFAIVLFLGTLLVLSACGGPTPKVQTPGDKLLAKVAQTLTAAKTLHGVFNWSVAEPSSNQLIKSEVWSETPFKNRVVILQSTQANFTTGTIAVTDGKQEWLYKPVQKVVYTGSVPAQSATPTAQQVKSLSGPGGYIGQGLSPLNQLLSFLTQSNATLGSTSASINGHSVTDVHIVSITNVSGSQYSGEVYIDNASKLPVQVVLNGKDSNTGKNAQEIIDIPLLTLDSTLPDTTFSFIPPKGTRVLPTSPNPGTSSLTLDQAQQQASYHLLSIPISVKSYVLQGVSVLGSTGHEIYELDYVNGNLNFAIDESKYFSQSDYPGKSIQVRGTTGTISTDSTGTTTLYWSENGLGFAISGSMTSDQATSVASLLM